MKQTQNFNDINGRIKLIHKSTSKTFNAREVQNEVQSRQGASGEEVENLRHELSQSQVEGTRYETLYNTSGTGAAAHSSEIQLLRQAGLQDDSLSQHGNSSEMRSVLLKRKLHEFFD